MRSACHIPAFAWLAGSPCSRMAGWQAPTTPPRKPSKQHVEDSPQGSAQSSLGIPATFKSTREFYDTQDIFGMNFPGKIQPSAWATKHGLAGRNLEDITRIVVARLAELQLERWRRDATSLRLDQLYPLDKRGDLRLLFLEALAGTETGSRPSCRVFLCRIRDSSAIRQP